MSSLFERSLALGVAADETQTLTSASRTTSDATFAVASGREGLIRVYAASCGALLHEFAAIHSHVYTLHYTSFSDSLVTLESDVKGEDNDEEEAETFLCVYHDWRERKMVRGYTLPLGVLESPSSKRKADCVAVCSFTGRVVVAMGTVLNIWQCSRGFFEHVMELKVDMTQRHAFMQVEYVAIHGVYVAYASQTEVRAMEIHVRSSEEVEETLKVNPALEKMTKWKDRKPKDEDGEAVPEDEAHCVKISSFQDVDVFVEIPVSCSAYSTMETDARREQDEQQIFDEHEQVPMVLGRNEAQQEIWHLAGLVKSQDIRTNQAMSYFIDENDVCVLLQRYLPPNHSVQSLKFLSETIDNRVCVETRSYTRLLVATEKNAFLYYFLSKQVDCTRKKMSKKVLGKDERSRSRCMHEPVRVGKAVGGQSKDACVSMDRAENEEEEEADGSTGSGRVVMHYSFTSVVTSITANSSFLFVATLSGLQVWSIWSPCHFVAASRALSNALVPQPSQPQLLCTQPLPYPVSQLAALDSYVVMLSQLIPLAYQRPNDIVHLASLAAAECLPENEFEMRPLHKSDENPYQNSIMIFQLSPPSVIFSYVRQGLLSTNGALKPFRIDLMLSLFSLYRYRADVGMDLLHLAASNDKDVAAYVSNLKDKLALELETKVYDRLARECAADLAAIFLSEHHRDLERAALLFVASNVPAVEVMHRLQAIVGAVDRSEVIQATGKYLEAFVFPPPISLGDICSSKMEQTGNLADTNFTRIVLSHYGNYFPEQLSRLIVDSSLKWTLEDISFALDLLEESSSNSVLVKIARLVLILRAATFPREDLNIFRTSQEAGVENFIDQFSNVSMLALIDDLLQHEEDALVHLAVMHPDLLVQQTSEESNRCLSISKLTKALLEKVPLKYMNILERIFNAALGRRETILSTLLFCLDAIGTAAAESAIRIASSMSSASSTVVEDSSVTPFVHDQALVLRFLMFVLQMVPTLEKLSENEEIHDDGETLQRAQQSVAAEFIRLCVKLSSSLIEGEPVGSTVCDLFEPVLSDTATHSQLPDWVHEYLKSRCLPEPLRLRRTLEFLFDQAVGLLHKSDVLRPQDVLSVYEVVDESNPIALPSWNLDNDFAALIVLLTLPRVSRTVEGLKLIAQRADYNLLLPYGKNFCVTVDEWRSLISIVSSIPEISTTASNDKSHSHGAILENILNHVCLTLSPEETLQVLPDDGDLDLYISTIEVSLRLNLARENLKESAGLQL
ncbi:hypothetical protein PsorP6_005693 [Peronosclerospora sorghi]|uniref:Uncharacterized protein n=1 Tax=Peronosclerospora sorghi TaxID=230839 RepID=A0ACC0W3Q0_9STRA|nr:hypothetical protein PsorP6_005693 [Peronosclerospora sorghi]